MKFDDKMTINIEAAEAAWSNLKTFYSNFKDHTLKGSAAYNASNEVVEKTVVEPLLPNQGVDCQMRAHVAQQLDI